ncbi:hypothetical protein, partial [Bacillus sp. W1]|uniref:hypothetical protein n=1 Tax=Bacillus sp. W1 TaxID=539236 RepID=UPI0029401049
MKRQFLFYDARQTNFIGEFDPRVLLALLDLKVSKDRRVLLALLDLKVSKDRRVLLALLDLK